MKFFKGTPRLDEMNLFESITSSVHEEGDIKKRPRLIVEWTHSLPKTFLSQSIEEITNRYKTEVGDYLNQTVLGNLRKTNTGTGTYTLTSSESRMFCCYSTQKNL